VSSYAAPARAENLAGLPPAFIAVGALDLFVEENIDYAKRLIASGVPTELKVYPGAYHGFDLIPGAKLAEACKRDMQDALMRAIGAG
jgi:triacylglycerol lipase